MKSFKDFLTEAMDPAVHMRVDTNISQEDFDASLKNWNWLSGEWNDGFVVLFGPEYDINKWISKHKV